jgi:hypothetical protein
MAMPDAITGDKRSRKGSAMPVSGAVRSAYRHCRQWRNDSRSSGSPKFAVLLKAEAEQAASRVVRQTRRSG